MRTYMQVYVFRLYVCMHRVDTAAVDGNDCQSRWTNAHKKQFCDLHWLANDNTTHTHAHKHGNGKPRNLQ